MYANEYDCSVTLKESHVFCTKESCPGYCPGTDTDGNLLTIVTPACTVCQCNCDGQTPEEKFTKRKRVGERGPPVKDYRYIEDSGGVRRSDRPSTFLFSNEMIKKEEREVDNIINKEMKLDNDRVLGLTQEGQLFSNNTELFVLAKAFGLLNSHDYNNLPAKIKQERYLNPEVINLFNKMVLIVGSIFCPNEGNLLLDSLTQDKMKTRKIVKLGEGLRFSFFFYSKITFSSFLKIIDAGNDEDFEAIELQANPQVVYDDGSGDGEEGVVDAIIGNVKFGEKGWTSRLTGTSIVSQSVVEKRANSWEKRKRVRGDGTSTMEDVIFLRETGRKDILTYAALKVAEFCLGENSPVRLKG